MTEKIVVTAGDVKKEAETLLSAAIFFGVVGLIVDDWYYKYPMYFLAIIILFGALTMLWKSSSVIQDATSHKE